MVALIEPGGVVDPAHLRTSVEEQLNQAQTQTARRSVRTRAWSLVRDLPELREVVEYDQGSVHVSVESPRVGGPTPDAIRDHIVRVLAEAGFWHVDVEFVPGGVPSH